MGQKRGDLGTLDPGPGPLIPACQGSFICVLFLPPCSDPAAIIQTRYRHSIGRFEHYVHYTGANKRLDEWVTKERIEKVDEDTVILMKNRVGDAPTIGLPIGSANGNGVLNKADVAESVLKKFKADDFFDGDRKITRNQKRMHVEINHLEEVFNFIKPFLYDILPKDYRIEGKKQKLAS